MSNSDIPDRVFGNTAPRDSSSSNGASIIVKDAYKIYKRGKIDVVALRGLNCEFYSGEVTVIMGPSGCGKTTILNMIGGLDRLSLRKDFITKIGMGTWPNREESFPNGLSPKFGDPRVIIPILGCCPNVRMRN